LPITVIIFIFTPPIINWFILFNNYYTKRQTSQAKNKFSFLFVLEYYTYQNFVSVVVVGNLVDVGLTIFRREEEKIFLYLNYPLPLKITNIRTVSLKKAPEQGAFFLRNCVRYLLF
jgi:hypothetical protein